MSPIAESWLAAVVQAFDKSVPTKAVAWEIAARADDDGLSAISRAYLAKATGLDERGTVRALRNLYRSGWVETYAPDDPLTRTPRTFKLATPAGDSARGDRAA